MKKYSLILIALCFILAPARQAFAVLSAAQTKVTPRAESGDFAYDFLSPAADITFTFGDQSFVASKSQAGAFRGISVISKTSLIKRPNLTGQDLLINFLSPTFEQKIQTVYYHYNTTKIYNYIKTLADKINIPVVEPKLVIEDGRVTEFTPPQDGQVVDAAQSTLQALDILEQGGTTIPLVVYKTNPQTSLSQLNNLGIRELVGRGESNFAGSPSNRRHNIDVGVGKMKGVIVNPGEEFSFNEYLGPVDGEHGFLPELVIKKSGTVPEFGGGLCQVSSTAFRAAMHAGLPITQRRNHAYAVQYYAPQGTDATIYPGVVDLKFMNDTPGAILIWPYLKDKNNLIFDFYGTKDDRQVTLEKPIQWDRKPDGSMKASWTRIVIKDGETSSSTFKSTYLPPALFHKTEEFAKPTTTPITNPAPPAAETSAKP